MAKSSLRRPRLLLDCAAALCAVLLLSCATEPPAPRDVAELAARAVEEAAAAGPIPGAAVGVIHGGETTFHYFGQARKGGADVGPDTVFEIASLTKPFTGLAAAIMAMAGDSPLDLGRSVASSLPAGWSVPQAWEGMTLMDLGTHFSGLPDTPPGLDFDLDPDRNAWGAFSTEDLRSYVAGAELDSEPGARFEYSNVGFGLLGICLGELSGGSLAEYLQTEVLEPLGMAGTSLAGDPSTIGGLATGYWLDREAVYATPSETFQGALGIRSTLPDMMRFLEAFAKAFRDGGQGRLERAMRLAGASARRIDDETGAGLDWLVLEREGERLTYHAGAVAGFTAFMGFDPGTGDGVVALVNHTAIPANPAVSIGYAVFSGLPELP